MQTTPAPTSYLIADGLLAVGSPLTTAKECRAPRSAPGRGLSLIRAVLPWLKGAACLRAGSDRDLRDIGLTRKDLSSSSHWPLSQDVATRLTIRANGGLGR